MIKNVLFDFGGVFVRLSRDIAVKRFEELGVDNAEKLLDPYQQQGLFLQLEEGKYTEEEFTDILNETYGISVTVNDVRHALMGFLAEVQQEKFDYLREEWPSGVRKLLVSNINPFVWSYARSGEMISSGASIDDYFERIYTSFEHKICKPKQDFFELIIEDAKIRPEETLFIDDGPVNTQVARELGFVSYCPDNGEDWRPILDKMLKK